MTQQATWWLQRWPTEAAAARVSCTMSSRWRVPVSALFSFCTCLCIVKRVFLCMSSFSLRMGSVMCVFLYCAHISQMCITYHGLVADSVWVNLLSERSDGFSLLYFLNPVSNPCGKRT